MASSELLKQIQAGRKLKTVETNDRSAPSLDKQKGGGVERSKGPDTRQGSNMTMTGGGPPQLGSLFAGGMPKLKPAGQSHSAKSSMLGKPPTIPKREASETPTDLLAPVKPHSDTTPKPRPTPPNRPTASQPSRLAPSIPPRPAPNAPPAATRPVPTTPTTPARKPPPPTRTGPPPTIPSRPSPSLPSRSEPPPTARPAPPRNVPRPVSASPGRAPPPPPPRPSSLLSPTKSAPPLPTRKTQVTAPVPAARVRELSEGDSALATPQTRSALLPPPSRVRTGSSTTTQAPPVRNGVGSNVPSADYGGHRFEVGDFPEPREFEGEKRKYSSGRERGSEFEVDSIM